ncbi:MAG: nucleotidyltransferase substrate binding protein [Firmicutes bacterium]|nr:nucleotidyltransferase substrate binding protein [Bacillota bacterium]
MFQSNGIIFIQRFLKEAGIPDSEIRTKRDLLREGARLGLIGAPEKWFAYYQARNETAHTYHPEIAARVYHEALEFYNEAVGLLDELKKEAKND